MCQPLEYWGLESSCFPGDFEMALFYTRRKSGVSQYGKQRKVGRGKLWFRTCHMANLESGSYGGMRLNGSR